MTDAAVRVRRAFIVERWGRCSWHQYVRSVSVADDGRDPAGMEAD